MTRGTLVRHLNRLIAQHQEVLSTVEVARPSAAFAQRQEFIDELKALVAATGGAESCGRPESLISRMWYAITSRFGARNSILRCYERVCEVDLPISVSSVLLRHYAAIKRYSYLSEVGSVSLPAKPPSSKATGSVHPKPSGSILQPTLPSVPSRRPWLVDDRASVRP